MKNETFATDNLGVNMQPNRVDNFVKSLAARQETQGGPRAAARPKVTEVDRELFAPAALAKLGSLDLISQTVVDGFLSGKHRSTHKGGCSEFAEFRTYAPGDDLRMLDWRHYAKSDRYYVKRFDDETNLQALLVVDKSGSMRFGRSTVTKWRYATMAAACLARLLMRQRDSAGLALVDNDVREYLRPLPRSSHLARLLSALSSAHAEGGSDLGSGLLRVAGRLSRRGMVMVLSDCFGDADSLANGLQHFRLRGHDVVVFQVLAPEEVSFPFTRSSRFLDLESSRRMHVHPAEIRRHYLEKFQAFQDELSASLSRAAIEHVVLTTDTDLGGALAHFLHRRAAAKNMARVATRR